MYTAEHLEQMRNVDISSVDIASLVNLKDVKIDRSLPYVERMKQYLGQVQNPYAFRVGGVSIKVEYTQNGRQLEDVMLSYLSSIKRQS